MNSTPAGARIFFDHNHVPDNPVDPIQIVTEQVSMLINGSISQYSPTAGTYNTLHNGAIIITRNRKPTLKGREVQISAGFQKDPLHFSKSMPSMVGTCEDTQTDMQGRAQQGVQQFFVDGAA